MIIFSTHPPLANMDLEVVVAKTNICLRTHFPILCWQQSTLLAGFQFSILALSAFKLPRPSRSTAFWRSWAWLLWQFIFSGIIIPSLPVQPLNLLLMKAHWFDLKTSTMGLNYDMWQEIRWNMIFKGKVIYPPVSFVSNVLDSNEVASSINKEHRTGHRQTW